MRNELNEVQLIDRWLFGQLDEEAAGRFRARLLVDEPLAEKVEAQRSAHGLVRRYARSCLRERLEVIYRGLLNEKDFADQLQTIFP